MNSSKGKEIIHARPVKESLIYMDLMQYEMENNNRWIDVAILGLGMVGFTGLVMRSKMIFFMPFINYNHLLEAHGHFTFAGWVSLSLLTLMVRKLLPEASYKNRVYQWLLGGLALSAWGMLIAYLFKGYGGLSIVFSFCFLLFTFIYSWFFIRDIRKTTLPKPVLLLAVSSVTCLLLSSSGTLIIAYIYLTHSFDAIVYRNALFTYLHFQYNGFFSLAVFALLFNLLYKHLSLAARKAAYRFAVVLCVSILPSLFLSYLWQNPNQWYRLVASLGSVLLLLLCVLFLKLLKYLRNYYLAEWAVVRFLIILSMGSFLLKTFLQCFTIFPQIGNLIFGNRPVIMGFLHLVFLGFISLFILVFFTKEGLLDITNRFTRVALMVFAIAILSNEITLITQGLASLVISGNKVFPWVLWIAAICLFAGTVFIGIARIKTKQVPR